MKKHKAKLTPIEYNKGLIAMGFDIADFEFEHNVNEDQIYIVWKRDDVEKPSDDSILNAKNGVPLDKGPHKMEIKRAHDAEFEQKYSSLDISLIMNGLGNDGDKEDLISYMGTMKAKLEERYAQIEEANSVEELESVVW